MNGDFFPGPDREFSQVLPPQLDIYKASAGSGKTFLLTLQYLQLLLESPRKYREILAVTFTNKATEEMKHRILTELKNLALGKQTMYGEKLLSAIDGLSAGELQQRTSNVYSAILHDYSRFSISTIDSFVQRVIRAFSYEIGLDAGFRLQLNADTVKEDLTERLYLLLDANRPLREWVVEMAINRLSEGKNWDFKSDMLELAGELFKERFQEFDLAMKSLTADERIAAFSALKNKVYAAVKSFEKDQCSIATTAVKMIDQNGLTVEDFHYGKAGFVNHFYKAVSGNFCEAGTRVRDFMTNPVKVAGAKATVQNKALIGNISNDLHQAMHTLVDHYDTHITEYYTAQAIRRNLYTLQLMQVFNEELSNYRSENNALLISDTHLLLRQLSKENEASFIFEKTGNRYQHFLIDEFQDTSVFQWDNFKPLLENSLAQGRYNLVVGDVKQAIYRWRSGDWRLLLSEVKKQLRAFSVAENSLRDNYRSAQPIIDFNNWLFATLPHRLQEKFNADMAVAPEEINTRLLASGYFHIIRDAYTDSFQAIPISAPAEGLVSFEFVEESLDEHDQPLKFTDEVLRRLPILIQELLDEQGYQARDITILTRNNWEAALVIESLMAYQQQPGTLAYNLISADALYISRNEAVQMIVSAMRWLMNESDTLSLAFLVKTIADRSNTTINQHQLYAANGTGKSLLPPGFTDNRTALQSLPLIELSNRLIALFSLNAQEADHAYLVAFMDLVLEWNRFGDEGLPAFLKYWNTEGSRKALASGNSLDAVEVMTIHKSKGLDFKVMILPFCNWALEPDAKKNNWLWVKTGETYFNEIPIVPVKYRKELGQSDFAYEYFEEQLLSQMDSLNLLYVAMTRARRQIIGYAPLPKKEDRIKTIGDLVYDVLRNQQQAGHASIPNVSEAFTDNLLLFGAISPSIEETQTDVPTGHNEVNLSSLIFGDWRSHLKIRAASLLPEEETVSLPRSRGLLLHHAISKIEAPEELENVLRQMQMKGMLTTALLNEMTPILERVLQHELLAGWRGGTMQRMSERDILTANGTMKRPDMVLTGHATTIVIDFKFTEGKDDASRRQVAEYVILLKQMQFKNVKGYLLYGLAGGAEEV